MDCISSSWMGSKKSALRVREKCWACALAWARIPPDGGIDRELGQAVFSAGWGASCCWCWTHWCPSGSGSSPSPVRATSLPFLFFWGCITRYKQRWELLMLVSKAILLGEGCCLEVIFSGGFSLFVLFVGGFLYFFFSGGRRSLPRFLDKAVICLLYMWLYCL